MPNEFGQGLQTGLSAFNSAVDNRRQDAQQEINRRLAEKQDGREEARLGLAQKSSASNELDSELMRRQRGKQIEGLEIDVAIKQAQQQAEAEGMEALSGFSQGIKTLDMAAPDAVTQYEQLTAQFLPKILPSQKARAIYEGLDGRARQGKAFFDSKMAETGLANIMSWAARNAPDLAANPPKTEDGKIDWRQFSQDVKDRQRERFEQDLKLRTANMDARVAAESSGALGGLKISAVDELAVKTQNQRILKAYEDRRLAQSAIAKALDPNAKAMAEAELRAINKDISEADREIERINSKYQGVGQAPVAAAPGQPTGGQSSYTTAEEVRSAFKSGEITREQALQELRSFGYQ